MLKIQIDLKKKILVSKNNPLQALKMFFLVNVVSVSAVVLVNVVVLCGSHLAIRHSGNVYGRVISFTYVAMALCNSGNNGWTGFTGHHD